MAQGQEVVDKFTDDDRQDGQSAKQLFEQRYFEDAAAKVKALAERHSDDPKILHNLAVCESHACGHRKQEDFRRAMQNVAQRLHVSLENSAGLEDVELVYLYMNWAILLFYTKQYHQASNIMNRLFALIDSLDEPLARKVLLLAADVWMNTHEMERLYNRVVPTIDRATSSGIGTSSTVEVLQQIQSGKSTASSAGWSDAELGQRTSDLESFRALCALQKARIHLVRRAYGFAKQELKHLDNLVYTPFAYVLYGLRAHVAYQRGKCAKAIQLLNSSAAHSSAAHAQNGAARLGDVRTVLFYNNVACVHYRLGKHNLASLYLRKAIKENEACFAELKAHYGPNVHASFPLKQFSTSKHYELLYNMGIELLFCRNPLAAFDCLMEVVPLFDKNPVLWLRIAECCIAAHRADNDVDRELAKKLKVLATTVGSGVHRKLILSVGVNPEYVISPDSSTVTLPTLEFAAQCLRNALHLLPAEDGFGIGGVDTFGPCGWRTATDASGVAGSGASSSTGLFGSGQSFASSTQSAAYGAGYPYQSPGPGAAYSGGSWPGSGVQSETEKLRAYLEAPIMCVAPKGVLLGSEVLGVRATVLAASAYVSLYLRDYIMAAHYANSLLRLPMISNALRLVGRMYLAESLTMMDKLGEALEYLKVDAINDVSPIFPGHRAYTQQQQQSQANASNPMKATIPLTAIYTWSPHTIASHLNAGNTTSTQRARGMLQYNMAVIHALTSDYQKANELLQNAATNIGSPLPAQLYSLRLYISLLEGQKKTIQVVLRDIYGHLAVNRIVPQ